MLKSPWLAPVLSLAITGYAYFTFEVVFAYADRMQAIELDCRSADGTLVHIDDRLFCFDKSTILKTYDY